MEEAHATSDLHPGRRSEALSMSARRIIGLAGMLFIPIACAHRAPPPASAPAVGIQDCGDVVDIADACPLVDGCPGSVPGCADAVREMLVRAGIQQSAIETENRRSRVFAARDERSMSSRSGSQRSRYCAIALAA